MLCHSREESCKLLYLRSLLLLPLSLPVCLFLSTFVTHPSTVDMWAGLTLCVSVGSRASVSFVTYVESVNLEESGVVCIKRFGI